MAELQKHDVDELIDAGRALSREGLVTAFGHVSCRTPGGRLLMTPPCPLGGLTPDLDFTELEVNAHDLPPGVPREAWIHLAIARARPDVGAICRAQPAVATAVTSAGVAIVPLHGQGAYVGSPVAVFDDPALVRDEARGEQLGRVLGQGSAVILRGNGAVTVGATVGEAAARMWVLEASARMNSLAAAAGTPAPLSASEQAAWLAVEAEILGRIWAYLRARPQGDTRSV